MDERDVMQVIREANSDLEQRLTKEPIELQYDSYSDIMYITLGGPTEAYSLSVDTTGFDEVYLRLDPESQKLTGIDILHFRRLFLENHPGWQSDAGFTKLFQLVGDGTDIRFRKDPRSGNAGDIFLHVPSTIRELVVA